MNTSFRSKDNTAFAKRPMSVGRAVAIAKSWAWGFFAKGILGFIYLAVISEGLRFIVPALAQRLYRLPGLSSLKAFEETHRLDLAPFFALFLLVAVFACAKHFVRFWLWAPEEFQASRHDGLVLGVGAVILGADAALFYAALTHMGWGSGFSLSAVLATAAYVAVLVYVSYVSVCLKAEEDNA